MTTIRSEGQGETKMRNLQDFQAIADGFDAMTCIMSVERRPEGGYGDIRIVTGNRRYLDSIAHPAPGTELLTTQFEPNCVYTRYLTRDLNFEDFCYRAAVQKKCLHSYAHPERMDVWFNMTFLPLAFEDGDVCYCSYTMEINFEASTEHLSNISGELASAVLETTLKLSGARDFQTAMGDVICDIRDICSARYCCILLMDKAQRRCSVLCEDRDPDVSASHISVLEDPAFYDIAESWRDTIAGSNCLIVKNEQDMEVVRERNPGWAKSLTDSGIRSIVLFPLESQKELLGYIWATNFKPENAGKIKETLELTTFILSAEIANYLLMKQLRHMSATDMLTGLYNRNEMNRWMSAYSNGAEPGPVGVIFADLNGLKAVNDADGHDAGDRLLQDAASALREVFGSYEVFRVGGDEFAVFLPGATDEELARKAEALRVAATHYDKVDFAIGWSAESKGRDIEAALGAADERMYEDKRHYYSLHPEKKRGI